MSQQEDKSHSGLDALWIFEFSPPGVEKIILNKVYYETKHSIPSIYKNSGAGTQYSMEIQTTKRQHQAVCLAQ